MPFVSYLDEESGMGHIATYHGRTFDHISHFTELVMRGPSAFSAAERELIAAFVSGLNACQFCHGIHSHTAAAYGVDHALFAALLTSVESAPVDPRLKPVLAYVRKLTLSPSRMTMADAQAVYDAGWDEQALHDAVAVCALFNFYNRMVEGHGVKGRPETFAGRGPRLKERGYMPDAIAPAGVPRPSAD